MLNTIELYRVKVRGVTAKSWTGLFIKMPDSKQIEEALRLDIAKFDLEIEHEYDQAYSFNLLLEIIPLYDSANGDDVRVAGVLIGTVIIESLQGFGEVEEVEEVEEVRLPTEIEIPIYPWKTLPVRASVIDGSVA